MQETYTAGHRDLFFRQALSLFLFLLQDDILFRQVWLGPMAQFTSATMPEGHMKSFFRILLLTSSAVTM